MTTNCPNCGAPIDISRSSCEYCGTPYEKEVYLVEAPSLRKEKRRCRMDRNKVVEKFISARNSDFRFIDMKELVDALMECAREEAMNELDKRVGIAMKECGLLKEVQE